MGLPPCHVNLSNLNQRPELLLAASWGESKKNGEPPGLQGPKSNIDRAPGSLRGRDEHDSIAVEAFPPAHITMVIAGGFAPLPSHAQPVI